MLLLEQIELQYGQAIRELDAAIAKRPDTAQARYDRKRAGHAPRPYLTNAEKVRHELAIERRWVLKGVQQTLEYILEHCQEYHPDGEIAWLKGELAHVENTLDERGEEDP